MTDHHQVLLDIESAANLVSCRMVELSKRPTEEGLAETIVALRIATWAVTALAPHMGNMDVRYEE